MCWMAFLVVHQGIWRCALWGHIVPNWRVQLWRASDRRLGQTPPVDHFGRLLQQGLYWEDLVQFLWKQRLLCSTEIKLWGLYRIYRGKGWCPHTHCSILLEFSKECWYVWCSRTYLSLSIQKCLGCMKTWTSRRTCSRPSYCLTHCCSLRVEVGREEAAQAVTTHCMKLQVMS